MLPPLPGTEEVYGIWFYFCVYVMLAVICDC